LAVRDACDAGELDPAEAAEEASRLGAAVDRLLAGQTCYAPNRKLLASGPGTRRAVHLPGHPGGAGDQLAR
jgi:hypothetical protein